MCLGYHGRAPQGVSEWFCYGGLAAALGVVVNFVYCSACGHLARPGWEVQGLHAQFLASVLGEEEAGCRERHIHQLSGRGVPQCQVQKKDAVQIDLFTIGLHCLLGCIH